MKKLTLFLVTMVLAVALVACTEKTTTTTATTTTTTTATTTTTRTPITETRVINDEYTLLLQSSTMDGIFSPFFYSSAYDGDVVGLTNVGLLTTNETGAVVASDYYPTVADSYSIFYTDNLTTYAPKAEYEEGDYVVYEIVIKNGALFSDGTEIDADDVLFNYYVYLDPAYSGSSTLYTLPILGLGDFRTQVPNSAQYAPIADAILAADERVDGYTTTTAYTEAQHDAYWAAMDAAGAGFAGEIVNYANSKLTQAYVTNYISDTLTVEQVKANAGLLVGWGMFYWGYAADLDYAAGTVTGASGAVYQIADLTNAVYFQEILDANTTAGKIDFAGGYQGLSDYESAGSDFVANAKELFTASYASLGSVPSVAGLVKGTKTVDAVEHETVKIVLTEQNPKAILSLGVTVAPQHYYTAGYTFPAGAIVNYGVHFDTDLYMAHLETFNGSPMGAGPYNFVSVDEGDGTVYFERNENFETMGGVNVYNANIKNVALKIISSGAEYSALEAGDVHYATVSATADVMEDIALTDNLVAVLVDNLGYGYICVNPQVYDNINERIALTTVFDMARVLDYYPNGLADIIYRSQSQVSWAYPEGATAIYPYDETLASAISYFTAAGMTFTAGVVSDFGGLKGSTTNPIVFTLPSDASAHPAGGIFIKAQTLLASIGITANIVSDPSLIANIKKGPVGVYALAWQSSQDPDMYQVYHYLSQAESVISNGIVWLYENGDNDALGTIDVEKLDGTTVEMNQKEALAYLAELIEEGTKYMLPEERSPIYAKALEVLAQLNIEVPTYQRKNLFVYDGSIVAQTSLSTSVTPYWGPMAEIWKVSFASGVEGNETTTVVVGYED
ncbi:MAG: hypothetical protein CVV56_07750 [Tenericutes bacterium HGW-Tenericutes-1]|jgi:peptide/nickel transport system substrate-binding protein|nr:MAG: hypothetical protein CVV56_07750 [Tenericutes bacterium HGW-Tenericutes-1]